MPHKCAILLNVQVNAGWDNLMKLFYHQYNCQENFFSNKTISMWKVLIQFDEGIKHIL